MLRALLNRFPYRLAVYRVAETPHADPFAGPFAGSFADEPAAAGRRGETIEPESAPDIDWETGDIQEAQQVDMRLGRFDGSAVALVMPCFGDGETDLYACFAEH